MIEFLLGNKNAEMLKVFEHDPAAQARLRAVLEAPSLYDEFLRYLARFGHAVPAQHLERDWSQPHAARPRACCRCSSGSTRTPTATGANTHLCEDLVDLETQFQLWRFRHMRTVERIIGFRRGTGGSSGRGFPEEGAGAGVLSRAVRSAHHAGTGSRGRAAPHLTAGAALRLHLRHRTRCGHLARMRDYAIRATHHEPDQPTTTRRPIFRSCSAIRGRCGCCS